MAARLTRAYVRLLSNTGKLFYGIAVRHSVKWTTLVFGLSDLTLAKRYTRCEIRAETVLILISLRRPFLEKADVVLDPMENLDRQMVAETERKYGH